VTGAWDLAFRLELGPYDGVERVIVDLQLKGLLDPLPQGLTGDDPGRLSEDLLNGGPSIGGQRKGLASRDIDRQQRLQATRFVKGEPVTDGVAMDPQSLGHLPAALRLPTGQEGEHLESWFLAPIIFTL
jgi:hypothetical protein